MAKRQRIIGYIENGIVIDHIPAGEVWRVAELLGVDKKRNGRVSLGDGYESKKMDFKGILKVEGIKLFRKQLNLIAIIAENANVSEIKEGKVVKKYEIKIPDVLEGIIKCPNKGCVSNDGYQRVMPIVRYNSARGFSCHYCSREFKKEGLDFIR